MEYIKGNYRKSIYQADNYIVGLFKLKETNSEELKNLINKTITFTGYFDTLNMDDLYCFKGETVETRYGTQFKVDTYERLKPEDEEGIVAFLSSNLFKGVGETLAKNIVNTLGKNALDEILKDSSCLLLVPKMTSKKAKNIYNVLSKYEESHQMIVYLTDLGFSMNEALDIYNYYKKDTITNLEYNPYKLIDDLNISFIKIDEIRDKFNILLDDERRVKACIIYVMKSLLFENGDTYLLKEEIYLNINKYLNTLDVDTFEIYIDELIRENKICLIDNMYYIKEMYVQESNIVSTIKYLVNKKIVKNNKIDELIILSEENNNIKYNDKQKEAIKLALNNNVTIITGGPGTGKTTIIKAICEIYQKLNNLEEDELIDEIALLAPTGRASKRLSTSTLLPASTIHRFLKWNKETNEFQVNDFNKNLSKFIIIDEASMIDLSLFDNLFRGLTKNIKLVLVGDHHQLPSVGPGNVLKDLITSGVIDTVYLETLYRQDENSYIPTLAKEIRENNLSNFLDTKSDYVFLKCSKESIIDNLNKLCYQLIDKGYNYKRVQIMAPMYAGINGIDNLNKQLQNVFNPKSQSKNEYRYGDVIYRENDKVLQLVNMPDDNVFNGDIGVIENIYKFDHKTIIEIDFDGNIVRYEPKDLNRIKHGFIISIHKSQGSEFEFVIMPICDGYKRMLYRKLIYTGITRAKKKLVLIGTPESLVYAANNDDKIIRKTNLKNILQKSIKKI